MVYLPTFGCFQRENYSKWEVNLPYSHGCDGKKLPQDGICLRGGHRFQQNLETLVQYPWFRLKIMQVGRWQRKPYLVVVSEPTQKNQGVFVGGYWKNTSSV